MYLATACLGFFLTLAPCNALHSMHTKSLKLQPLSSSSAKGHTGKHEEHARNHEDLLALWVAFKAEAMHQPTSCTLSMFQSLSMPWPVLLKNLVGKESSDQWQEKSRASSFAADLKELRSSNKFAVGTMPKELRNARGPAAWKQACTFCALKTLLPNSVTHWLDSILLPNSAKNKDDP